MIIRALSLFGCHHQASGAAFHIITGANVAARRNLELRGECPNHDPAIDRYIWKAERSWRGIYRRLTVELSDGSPHVTLFQFR